MKPEDQVTPEHRAADANSPEKENSGFMGKLRNKLKDTHLYDAKVGAIHLKHRIGKFQNLINSNHRHDEEHEQLTDAKRTAIAEEHRFQSFAPEREGMAGFGNFDRTIDAIDGWLSSHDYVCGARFTMADVYVGSQIDWGLQFGSIPTRPAFEAYAGRLRQREVYQAAKAIDGKLIADAHANA